MATIVEVARLAGVSTSTVSHVLNGTRNVEPKTRKKVVEAIEKTGYRQDAVARAMRRSRTDSIGLVVSDAGEPAFADMVHGVEHAAAARGLTLLLANSAEDPERETRAVRTLLQRRVDGLIVARCPRSSSEVEGQMSHATPPVVLLDRVFDRAPCDQVGADNRESMRRLAEHLLGRGHRRLVVVAGDTRVPTLTERLAGFRDAIAARSDVDAAILEGAEAEPLKAGLVESIAAGGRTCVITASSPLAVMALQSLRDLHLAVPEDIAFATFDGFHHSDLFRPSITTVRQPAFDMGVAAVGLLLERLESPDASPRITRLQQRLELRSSSEDYVFAALGAGN
ncbi:MULTISPECIES: LacI family DNA-binding transcriptional regulator [unclassified Nocardioides]|uniref:LacI family DNA-binding transcriptional regulator n=1 Tax=unclassified Nocardioides TaxID=2615069 RepID=UPI000056F86B|nr:MULTISPECIES: LacI family DNA-binding transcriptional regulator [unclassified Nocardioides]ABL79607.1 transcriptional regulator, LacI family [Nocardioides sp. JS614]